MPKPKISEIWSFTRPGLIVIMTSTAWWNNSAPPRPPHPHQIRSAIQHPRLYSYRVDLLLAPNFDQTHVSGVRVPSGDCGDDWFIQLRKRKQHWVRDEYWFVRLIFYQLLSLFVNVSLIGSFSRFVFLWRKSISGTNARDFFSVQIRTSLASPPSVSARATVVANHFWDGLKCHTKQRPVNQNWALLGIHPALGCSKGSIVECSLKAVAFKKNHDNSSVSKGRIKYNESQVPSTNLFFFLQMCKQKHSLLISLTSMMESVSGSVMILSRSGASSPDWMWKDLIMRWVSP